MLDTTFLRRLPTPRHIRLAQRGLFTTAALLSGTLIGYAVLEAVHATVSHTAHASRSQAAAQCLKILDLVPPEVYSSFWMGFELFAVWIDVLLTAGLQGILLRTLQTTYLYSATVLRRRRLLILLAMPPLAILMALPFLTLSRPPTSKCAFAPAHNAYVCRGGSRSVASWLLDGQDSAQCRRAMEVALLEKSVPNCGSVDMRGDEAVVQKVAAQVVGAAFEARLLPRLIGRYVVRVLMMGAEMIAVIWGRKDRDNKGERGDGLVIAAALVFVSTMNEASKIFLETSLNGRRRESMRTIACGCAGKDGGDGLVWMAYVPDMLGTVALAVVLARQSSEIDGEGETEGNNDGESTEEDMSEIQVDVGVEEEEVQNERSSEEGIDRIQVVIKSRRPVERLTIHDAFCSDEIQESSGATILTR